MENMTLYHAKRISTDPAIEIDGQPFEYTHFYPPGEWIGGIPLGAILGSDEITEAGDEVRHSIPYKEIGVVNVYRENPDGSITGIRAAFAKAVWSVTDDGDPLFSVSERVA